MQTQVLAQANTRPAASCRGPRPFTSVQQPVRGTPVLRQHFQTARHCRLVAVRVSAAAAPVEQGPENMKIRIKLKSYWVDLLQHSVNQIIEAAESTGASIAGPVPLPTRKKIYTVLRSPHVNKDSREQFETRLHQRLIDVKDLSAETVDRLMQLDMPAGVDVQVKL
ncbi:hypothetical protein N2152v2_005817 [Parachlorella kessleri]